MCKKTDILSIVLTWLYYVVTTETIYKGYGGLLTTLIPQYHFPIRL